jgi:hypothetical protein
VIEMARLNDTDALIERGIRRRQLEMHSGPDLSGQKDHPEQHFQHYKGGRFVNNPDPDVGGGLQGAKQYLCEVVGGAGNSKMRGR